MKSSWAASPAKDKVAQGRRPVDTIGLFVKLGRTLSEQVLM